MNIFGCIKDLNIFIRVNMTNRLSIAMITKNSQKYLDEVLSSCSFADEIVLVDSGSTDKTLKIAQKHNAKVIRQKWLGFGKQKQFAVNCCKNDWIFVLDSDEVITQKLQNEIMQTLKSPTYKAYKVARLNFFFGKAIKHCGLYPDFTIRLFDKNYAYFSEDEVHERVIANSTNTLKNHFLHYAYEDIFQFINKQQKYAKLSNKNSKIKAILNPCWTFFKIYFLKLGFLDGWHGFIIAKLYSQYTFWKYIK